MQASVRTILRAYLAAGRMSVILLWAVVVQTATNILVQTHVLLQAANGACAIKKAAGIIQQAQSVRQTISLAALGQRWIITAMNRAAGMPKHRQNADQVVPGWPTWASARKRTAGIMRIAQAA